MSTLLVNAAPTTDHPSSCCVYLQLAVETLGHSIYLILSQKSLTITIVVKKGVGGL
jgi:hypothetical protein